MKKFAIVTGASRGIGLAVAKYLATNNYDLALISKNSERLENAALQVAAINDQIQVNRYPIDISDPEAAYALTKEIIAGAKHIDVLFNSAGILSHGTDEITISEYQQLMNTNVIGLFAIAKATAEIMSTQNSGYIMNLASMAGRRGLPNLGAYCSTKYAVVGFSDSLHKKYCAQGVKVTAICPSVVDTDMTKHFSMGDHEKIELDDLVKTVDYLLSLSPSAVIPVAEIQCAAMIIGTALLN